MDEVARQDWKFVKVDPDPDFSPQHNRRVIDEVIKESDALSRERRREFAEGLGERASALASFISAVNLGGKSESAEKYFGKKFLKHLKGEDKIAERQSKDGLKIVNNKGKVIRKPYEVTVR